ncbi:Ank1 [Symbiodinium sp. KB8]|nr:Ank1 [Symbiodinium sp. KB8]
MSEADTCEITAVERADRGSNAGKDTGLLEFLTIGECSYVAFLIYGALLGSLSGMGPGTLAIIGIVLLCWPIAAFKVCCRCCRKCCCSCCREGKEVRKIGNVKKIVILLLSLAGLGGMAALPMAGIMGDVKAGTAVANSADCASREFLRSALGDVTAIGSAASVPAGSSGGADPDPGSNSSRLLQGASFIGIATASQEVQTVSAAVDALATAATQAAGQDSGAADHVAESLGILRLMQDSLSAQISVGGSTCTFCETCCGTQAGALVPQLLSQLEGTPSRVTTLSADFQEQPGSRISSLRAAVVSAGAALSLLQQSFQAGPAAALILGSDLFVDPLSEMVVMGFEFGAVPIAGDGFFYSPGFLNEVQVQALRAAVESGPSGDETISTGRPLAATPGVHWHGFPRPHSRHESEITILDACGPMLLELRERGILPPGYWFDQAIVNFYSEGDGIPMHVDRANFDDYIVGFSLGAPVVMDLEPLDLRESFPAKHQAEEEEGCEAERAERSCGQHVLLEEGSVYVFSGKVRWKWKHGIRPNCRYQGQELPLGSRTSVTFRRLRRPGLTDSDAIWAPVSIGLVFLFYSLHWCCCLRRCKIDRKDHPAPQWAACGWCGGCLGALLAAVLGIVTFASAAVGSEFCIMMDTLSASDGLDRYGILLGLSGDSTQVVAARSASLACLGPAADVPSRDLFPMLGLSVPIQGLSEMATDLSSVLSFDFAPLLTQYQTLNAQAQSSASTFTPTPADATSQVYTCYTWISITQAPTSTSCDLPTFQANMQTLAQLALQSGQDASAALGTIRQPQSTWQSTLSDMQALSAHPSLAALQSGLDCGEVFDAWQVANDQACAGLADTFSTSGFVWLLAGACGFVGALGQYWIWRNLKDNRTLFFDEHEDMKPKGMKKLFCGLCATSVGDDLDAGKTQAEESPKEPSEKAASRSKSTGGAKTSVASKRIAIRFFEAFEMSVEENVKAFLRDELYPSYDESFKNMAVADRMASWKALEKQKQSGGDVEVQPPGEQPTDPATLFSDYGERGPDGVPTADSEGKPLDKKKLAALKKDLALLQKPWDKWQNDKRKYEAYLLSKIRKQCLEKYAEVQYTEEVEHLRPLSPTSRPITGRAHRNIRVWREQQISQHMRSSGAMPGGAWLGNPQQKERFEVEERLKRHKAAVLAEGKAIVHSTYLRGKGTRSGWVPQVVTSHLLEFSADVEATDSKGWSPLCGAASKGHTSIVRLLLEFGADPERSVTVTGHGMLTPLRAAKEGRFLEVADVLKTAITQGNAQQQKRNNIISNIPMIGSVLERKASTGRASPARSTPESVSSRRSEVSSLAVVSDCLKGCCCCCQQKLTMTPLVVVVEEVPEDRDRAVWSDELEPVVGPKLDARVRKDKAVAKKLKGLEDRCFKSVSVHDPLMKKLMALSDDQQLWEGIKIQAAKKPTKMKPPKEPKAPKGLVDPADHFKSGKHEGKFGAFDKGVPTQMADGTEIPEKKLKALKKEYDSVKDKWDKHQQAMAKYSQDLTKYEKWKEGGEEDFGASGVPEAQRSAACETAALEVLRRLLDRSVTEHAEELSVEVNQGSHDPPELAALMVKVVLEHEDKTTDPVLKVLKTVDKKKRSGMVEVGELPEVFRLLKEDELQVGTHVCFGDITYEEVDFVSSVLEKSSLAKEGQISHEDLKAFIENQDLQPSETGHPSSLAGSLVFMRLEAWKKASSVEKLMSPRAWRLQLSGNGLGPETEAKEAPGKAAEEEEPKETNAPAEAPVEPSKEETSGKDKEKKEKKEKK